MNYRSTQEVGIDKKNKPRPNIKQSKVNLNIVSTKDYTGINETVIYGFKCFGGHPGLNGKWEQYKS